MNTFYGYYFYSRYKCVEDSFQNFEKLEVRKRDSKMERKIEEKGEKEGRNESVSFMAL